MIFDTIENCSLYLVLGYRIRLALEYIRTADYSQWEAGRYDLDGDNLYVMMNDYKTIRREEGHLEGHRKYIDVQYMVQGTEWIGYAPLSHQSIVMDYAEDDDCILYKGEATFLKFEKGMFAVFFPQDLHFPGTGEDSTPVRKVVVKVKLPI